MIIPSTIHLKERLRAYEEDSGIFLVQNAYDGDYQEFFQGRLTPLSVPDPIADATSALHASERFKDVAISLGLTSDFFKV